MTNQGFRFQNFFNNQSATERPFPVYQGFNFQSLLQPITEAAPSAWDRTPQSILEYEKTLRDQGHSPEAITSAKERAPRSPSIQEQKINNLLGIAEKTAEQNAYWQSPEGMEQQLAMGRKMAQGQAEDMLKYQTLANLPGQIERAFAADKYYAGISQIPEIYRGTFASVPSMNIQSPGYSASQVRYFS